MSRSEDNIIWIDMEMTGLDPNKDKILEIACLITNGSLEMISDKFNVVIKQDSETLGQMNDWCLEHHTKSGLVQECLISNITLADAEQSLLDFIQRLTPKGYCPLAGSTVYMDKIFMMKYLPRVVEHLHYRIIDVSSIHELVRRWFPDFKPLRKKNVHRALPDILESIQELDLFREKIFKLGSSNYTETTSTSDLDLFEMAVHLP